MSQCKCARCGRTLKKSIIINDRAYGPVCSKKIKFEEIIIQAGEVSSTSPAPVTNEIDLPLETSLNEIKEALETNIVYLHRPDGTTRKLSSFIELELFPESYHLQHVS